MSLNELGRRQWAIVKAKATMTAMAVSPPTQAITIYMIRPLDEGREIGIAWSSSSALATSTLDDELRIALPTRSEATMLTSSRKTIVFQ